MKFNFWLAFAIALQFFKAAKGDSDQEIDRPIEKKRRVPFGSSDERLLARQIRYEGDNNGKLAPDFTAQLNNGDSNSGRKPAIAHGNGITAKIGTPSSNLSFTNITSEGILNSGGGSALQALGPGDLVNSSVSSLASKVDTTKTPPAVGSGEGPISAGNHGTAVTETQAVGNLGTAKGGVQGVISGSSNVEDKVGSSSYASSVVTGTTSRGFSQGALPAGSSGGDTQSTPFIDDRDEFGTAGVTVPANLAAGDNTQGGEITGSIAIDPARIDRESTAGDRGNFGAAGKPEAGTLKTEISDLGSLHNLTVVYPSSSGNILGSQGLSVNAPLKNAETVLETTLSGNSPGITKVPPTNGDGNSALINNGASVQEESAGSKSTSDNDQGNFVAVGDTVDGSQGLLGSLRNSLGSSQSSNGEEKQSGSDGLLTNLETGGLSLTGDKNQQETLGNTEGNSKIGNKNILGNLQGVLNPLGNGLGSPQGSSSQESSGAAVGLNSLLGTVPLGGSILGEGDNKKESQSATQGSKKLESGSVQSGTQDTLGSLGNNLGLSQSLDGEKITPISDARNANEQGGSTGLLGGLPLDSILGTENTQKGTQGSAQENNVAGGSQGILDSLGLGLSQASSPQLNTPRGDSSSKSKIGSSNLLPVNLPLGGLGLGSGAENNKKVSQKNPDPETQTTKKIYSGGNAVNEAVLTGPPETENSGSSSGYFSTNSQRQHKGDYARRNRKWWAN